MQRVMDATLGQNPTEPHMQVIISINIVIIAILFRMDVMQKKNQA